MISVSVYTKRPATPRRCTSGTCDDHADRNVASGSQLPRRAVIKLFQALRGEAMGPGLEKRGRGAKVMFYHLRILHPPPPVRVAPASHLRGESSAHTVHYRLLVRFPSARESAETSRSRYMRQGYGFLPVRGCCAAPLAERS